MEYKIFPCEVKEYDEKDLTVVHFISTEKRDRGGDILYAEENPKGKGMVIEGRPVVLKCHGFSDIGQEPIAKPIWIKSGEFKNRKGIQCKTQFFPDETGKRLWRKNIEGYMPSWSVGWRPMEGKVEIKQDENGETRHIYEWELLEYSLVAVPMQPDAQTMSDGAQIMFKMILDKDSCDLCGKSSSPESESKKIELKSYKNTSMMLCAKCLKDMENEEKRFGELVMWRKTIQDTWEMKPYPNEHSCRLESPEKYIRIRRQNDKFGNGIHAIWGVQGGGKPVELQAIRFSKERYTVAEAKSWLKEHDYKCKLFEAASEKCLECGSEMIFKWTILSEAKEEMDGLYICEHCREIKNIVPYKINTFTSKKEAKRWNKSLPELFDLDIDNRPPATWEYDLYQKFLKCKVKDIFLNCYQIPSPLLGTYLSGIKQISEKFTLLDTRNFTRDGFEAPPVREVIKLNSTKSDDFLVSGIEFFKYKKYEEIPFLLKFSSNWYGIEIHIITDVTHSEFNKGLLEEIHQWVKKNNFLKGERFALSGDFLEKTDDTWNDLVLEDDLKTIVRNAINQLNSKKGEMKSRGLLFMGRPGTGKTKAGRTIMNDSDSTFIWVSSKDFQYGSSVGMISLAFSLAKDLSPAIIFMEDIDTWLGNYLVDLLKTEMDGLRQNKGIMTILTSNNPENLPDALLDRPGRFHHVLDFKLPNAKQRLSMINLWIEEKIDERIINEIVKKTDGFSGAHLKELVDFAKIISEENSIDMGIAIQKSLKRLMDQRELIDDIRKNKKSYVLPKMYEIKEKSKQNDWDYEDNEDYEEVHEEAASLLEDETVIFKIVDGDKIRKEEEAGFTMGGNHYSNSDLIGAEDEIWIDQRMVDEDIIATKASQYIERLLMKYWGFGHEQARNIANVIEKVIRHVTDPEEEGSGEHNEDHRHYYNHLGNHHHNEGRTINHGWEMESFLKCGIDIPEDKKEKFSKDLKLAIKKIAIENGLISAEPVADDSKQTDNPPEPRRIVIINSDEERKKAEEQKRESLREMLKPVSLQIDEMIKKIPEIVKEEIARLRGRVN